MQLPLQVTFRNVDPSPAVEANIREKTDKLNQYYDRIMGCRVVVELGHHHKHKGNLYHIHIDLTVPDGELAVSRDKGKNHAHEDVYVAVRDAFEAARKQLQGYAKKRRGRVKRHDPPPHGRVVRLFDGDGYGMIETPDGREVYFHRNSLLNGSLEQLQVGDEVRFAEEAGEKGPQASSVSVVGKHHIVG